MCAVQTHAGCDHDNLLKHGCMFERSASGCSTFVFMSALVYLEDEEYMLFHLSMVVAPCEIHVVDMG